MNHFFITGTSRGIGKALAEQLLKDPENFVSGTSRGEVLTTSSYRHFRADLSELTEIYGLAEVFFKPEDHAGKLVLINNAGTLGEAGHLGNISNESLAKLYTLNVIAPVILMNTFISRFKNHKAEKIILNISSGAGQKPKDGWAGYCSSKAALDMASKVADVENELHDYNFKVYSVSPGIVDTQMQAEIRSTSKETFSDFDRFVKYKENGELSNPEITAQKIISIIQNISKFDEVLQDVRNL